MENPHEELQNALLSRIIGNVEKLNEEVNSLNERLKNVNQHNLNVELLTQMWENYLRSAKLQMEGNEELEKPL